MLRRKLFFSSFVCTLFLLVVFLPVHGVNVEKTVNAQVTLTNLGISVTAPDPIDYGALPIDGISQPAGPIIIENIGTVDENFGLRGENATNGTDTWTLASGAGADQFRHAWGHSPFTFPGDFDGHDLDDTYEPRNVIATHVAPLEIDTVKTVFHMPTYTTAVGTFITKIWVRATATPTP